MVNPEPRRRISYTLPPPPAHGRPALAFPPPDAPKLGRSTPLIFSARGPTTTSPSRPRSESSLKGHGRHRLGVTSLALDTSTVVHGCSSPRGILYSAGRDGMIISWDLGIRLREKADESDEEPSKRKRENWEAITGWANDFDDSDEEETSGDIIGEVQKSRSQRGIQRGEGIRQPVWTLADTDGESESSRTQFRQGTQAHTEWINDLKLCNENQTVISASSDGTVKAWSPHYPSAGGPSTIGQHQDYVRCLGVCHSQSWVASGSFDKTIKLWDVARLWGSSATIEDPLATLSGTDTDCASIYALAVDQAGSIVASGGPDKMIRMWDPRAGIGGRGGRNGKLVGHTDNIRSILISQDSRYMLTASSDASIKLWSLSSQRCLHTFTHHTESVWKLWSDDPCLGIFYSGDKCGNVCRVDVKSEMYNVGDGECILLCSESRETTDTTQRDIGISSIVALDNKYMWTASGGHPTINKWKIPANKTERTTTQAPTLRRDNTITGDDTDTWGTAKTPSIMSTSSANILEQPVYPSLGSPKAFDSDDQHFGVPYDAMVRLGESVIVYGSGRPGGFTRSSIRSSHSLMTMARPQTDHPLSPSSTAISSGPAISASRRPTSPQLMGKAAYQLREIAAQATPFCQSGPLEVVSGDVGIIRAILLNDRIHAISVDSVGNVGVWDIVRGAWKGSYRAAEVRPLLQGAEYSPREVLECVRSRIEGEAFVPSWCSVDTKSGVLNIHMLERSCFEAEVFADEIGFNEEKGFNDEIRLNLGKVILKNLFSAFLKEEARLYARRQRPPANDMQSVQDSEFRRKSDPFPSISRLSSPVFTSSSFRPAISIAPPNERSRVSPLVTPLIPIHALKETSSPLSSIPQSPTVHDGDSSNADGSLPPLKPLRRLRSGTLDSQLGPSNDGGDHQSGFTPVATVPVSPGDEKDSPLSPAGFMGRLKNLGKKPSNSAPAKVPEASVALAPTPASEDIVEIQATQENVPKTLAETLLAQHYLSPPPSTEAPSLGLSSRIAVVISEESAPGYQTLYRGSVSSSQQLDTLRALEEAMPQWLLEYLFFNKLPPGVPSSQKINFTMIPCKVKEGEDDEQLPGLLAGPQSVLSASRFMRVKTLTLHVQDKLDKIASSNPSTPASTDSFSHAGKDGRKSRPQPEDLYDILCNDVVLPVDMTLGQIRHYVWKQATDLVIHYRKKDGLKMKNKRGP